MANQVSNQSPLYIKASEAGKNGNISELFKIRIELEAKVSEVFDDIMCYFCLDACRSNYFEIAEDALKIIPIVNSNLRAKVASRIQSYKVLRFADMSILKSSTLLRYLPEQQHIDLELRLARKDQIHLDFESRLNKLLNFHKSLRKRISKIFNNMTQRFISNACKSGYFKEAKHLLGNIPYSKLVEELKEEIDFYEEQTIFYKRISENSSEFGYLNENSKMEIAYLAGKKCDLLLFHKILSATENENFKNIVRFNFVLGAYQSGFHDIAINIAYTISNVSERNNLMVMINN